MYHNVIIEQSWMPLLNGPVDEVLASALMFRLLNLFYFLINVYTEFTDHCFCRICLNFLCTPSFFVAKQFIRSLLAFLTVWLIKNSVNRSVAFCFFYVWEHSLFAHNILHIWQD